MNATDSSSTPRTNHILVWIGRMIAALSAIVFGMSGVMKLAGGQAITEGFAKMGLPENMRVPLGIVELICLVAYLVPQTSVMGAILLTGYMGGAICTHWRVGEGFLPQIVIGILIWLGLALREPRLWQLIPFRK